MTQPRKRRGAPGADDADEVAEDFAAADADADAVAAAIASVEAIPGGGGGTGSGCPFQDLSRH